MLDTCCGGWNEWDQAVRACVHGSALCSLWRSRARLHIEETGQHKQKCPRCIIYPTTLDMRVLQHSTQFFVLQEWQNKRIEGVIVCLQYERARFAFSSVQFSHSVRSDSLRPHGLQHARLPCPSPTPRAYSNSCPLSQWCYPTISSSVVPFFSHLWSFPASGSFPMSQFFISGGQSIGVSASASVLPMDIQDWFPLGWTPCSPSNSQEFSPTPRFKSINSSTQLSLWSNSHIHTWLLVCISVRFSKVSMDHMNQL